MKQQPYALRQLRTGGSVALLALCLALVGLPLPGLSAVPQPVAAATLPTVSYNTTEKMIYVGEYYEDRITGLDPVNDDLYQFYAGYPSHPDAPKDTITLPELKQALDQQGYGQLLEDQGNGEWLLRSDTTILPTARLNVTSGTVTWFKLDSTPDRFPAYSRLIATGGHLYFEGVKVTSWDNVKGGIDEEYFDGRSFLLAQIGGRMDIINSEVAYLGWKAGEPSGLSWRKRATPEDPATGATGSIISSDIHHNYFGQYSYEAYGLSALYNKFRDNIYYGFDPHDFSTQFEVAYNQVYNNGKHGIIFSRGCEYNWIHHNLVYDNAEHGIMLDRGSNNNKISDNVIYNNRDGIAIFQSSNNLIQENESYDNERGMRINATYDEDDIYDGISSENTVVRNKFTNNSQYGLYLYERADKNIIVDNEVTDNANAGIYIKTGSNTIRDNQIKRNGSGITIIGGETYKLVVGGPTPVPPVSESGYKNEIYANTIEDNAEIGVQIRNGEKNYVGPKDPEREPDDANFIRTNGTDGVVLKDGSFDNLVNGNVIAGNSRHGVLIKDATTIQNGISRNVFTGNGGKGISLSDGAHSGILPPALTSADDASSLTGTAIARGTVEIYRGQNGQGQFYLGEAAVETDGTWQFTLPSDDNPTNGDLILLAMDRDDNTSEFFSTAPIEIKATYSVEQGEVGEPVVYIVGESAEVTLPDIKAGLDELEPGQRYLEDQGNGVWQANASLFINRGVTLRLNSDIVTWLKLRSQGSDISLATDAEGEAQYNYKSFVTVKTYNGQILVDGVKITSWDPQTSDYDYDISDGRSYLLAKYDARMDFTNAEVSYLGSADGESYGIAWRDINSSEEPGVERTRVTGDVTNSIFSYNYYGIYTFQASNMTFKGNKFHNNISYGFDPHDISHNFLVEDNEAFENGNHGFIISRGCYNFTFRNNKSYNNKYTVNDADRKAHGFMIDPGSPNSQFEQLPSNNNLLENNEAWGNDGYGIRILGSTDNTIRNNIFRDNYRGITLEDGSTGNTVTGNQLTNNTASGLYIVGGADSNQIDGNTISGNGRHGVYVKTGGNTINNNTITNNGTVSESGDREGAGIALLPEKDLVSSLADFNPPAEPLDLDSLVVDAELLTTQAQATQLTSNVITNNAISGSADDGIEMKGASNTNVSGNTVMHNGVHGIYLSLYVSLGAVQNTITGNIVYGNKGHGIRANGDLSHTNTWSQNEVYENSAGGIRTSSGANANIAPPEITGQDGRTIVGTAQPGTMIEIYSDMNGQGRYYEGKTTADQDGTFTFTVAGAWQGTDINATATDTSGNSSGYTYDIGYAQIVSTTYLPIIVNGSN